jgi:hypothetical protein
MLRIMHALSATFRHSREVGTDLRIPNRGLRPLRRASGLNKSRLAHCDGPGSPVRRWTACAAVYQQLGQAAHRGRLSRMAITARDQSWPSEQQQRRTLNWPDPVTRAFRSGQYHPTARICRRVRRFPLGKGCSSFTVITSVHARRRGSDSALLRQLLCNSMSQLSSTPQLKRE